MSPFVFTTVPCQMSSLKSDIFRSYVQSSKRDTEVKNRLLDSVGGGEGGTIWKIGIETYTLPYVKQMISARLMNEAGHSKPVFWDYPEGWDGKGGGREVQNVGHMCTHGWFMLMFGKNHHDV